MNPSRRILLSGLGGLALLSACGRRDEASAGGEGLTDLRDRAVRALPPGGKLSIDDGRT
ncbi:hypothetical protein MU852_03270 [Brevundimonas albigilva]|uniref:hypothetical protein n=1 Tax=Brevundimonas albigilva TaxID=1312364 RepID=UPI00201B6E32|nr:hypothetical protein [Brevundimonas albigilva]UQV18914.1 hypothetical protein MU852_03270 [Brevundimonas albigilva]